MSLIISFLCGAIMSFGLIFSGMVNPGKVIGFLDILGQFDPTLAFVMAGALLVAMPGFRLIKRCQKPVLCDQFDKPSKTTIDAPLVCGSAIFGIGWGLAGFCPGPGLVGMGLGVEKAFIFVLAMLAGMVVAKYFFPR